MTITMDPWWLLAAAWAIMFVAYLRERRNR